jgi:hypothetical protein
MNTHVLRRPIEAGHVSRSLARGTRWRSLGGTPARRSIPETWSARSCSRPAGLPDSAGHLAARIRGESSRAFSGHAVLDD